MDSAEHGWVFGYGSLVNRATHDYPDARPARLTGWRRAWRLTDLRPAPFLTAVRAPGHAIDGLLAPVAAEAWPALDLREAGYERVDAAAMITHGLPGAPRIAVYAVPEAAHRPPAPSHAVRLSYLDAVVQGYLAEFGEAGAQAFFETTDGWDTPILDDRAAPLYPRHCALSRHERAFVDAQLARLSAQMQQAE
ncbi:gamma-glutamylcyclotransferase [Roseovarius sp. LXJ103]|uniref:gamma-glutamylcyclotransferase family protein n=1 Tax=Roseovarius carneus TaxID=2853164 RepID=UPI000D6068EA|nr:gamma-glutamylcyclotransferase family protein [Roseovarius carneus]MBZ8118335.1 gamma-glutamylcyclotransferase [Roseovarius carneus]PWE35951.1 gamma-glutamylcyclotransferase [Pelagicola sp. LXJ1103]